MKYCIAIRHSPDYHHEYLADVHVIEAFDAEEALHKLKEKLGRRFLFDVRVSPAENWLDEKELIAKEFSDKLNNWKIRRKTLC